MDIETIKSLFKSDNVQWSTHCVERMHERSITYNDVESCIMTGEIIEDYPDDFPHPSCLIFGKDSNGNIIHVVSGSDGDKLYIITAYHPSTDKFEADLKTRKES